MKTYRLVMYATVEAETLDEAWREASVKTAAANFPSFHIKGVVEIVKLRAVFQDGEVSEAKSGTREEVIAKLERENEWRLPWAALVDADDTQAIAAAVRKQRGHTYEPVRTAGDAAHEPGVNVVDVQRRIRNGQ